MNHEFFMYRDYPLVRSGKQLYYGFMSDPYVVMINIESQQEGVDGLPIANKVKVYQMSTSEKDPTKAFVKNADRSSLYEAVDLAHAWLNQASKKTSAK